MPQFYTPTDPTPFELFQMERYGNVLKPQETGIGDIRGDAFQDWWDKEETKLLIENEMV